MVYFQNKILNYVSWDFMDDEPPFNPIRTWISLGSATFIGSIYYRYRPWPLCLFGIYGLSTYFNFHKHKHQLTVIPTDESSSKLIIRHYCLVDFHPGRCVLPRLFAESLWIMVMTKEGKFYEGRQRSIVFLWIAVKTYYPATPTEYFTIQNF